MVLFDCHKSRFTCPSREISMQLSTKWCRSTHSQISSDALFFYLQSRWWRHWRMRHACTPSWQGWERESGKKICLNWVRSQGLNFCKLQLEPLLTKSFQSAPFYPLHKLKIWEALKLDYGHRDWIMEARRVGGTCVLRPGCVVLNVCPAAPTPTISHPEQTAVASKPSWKRVTRCFICNRDHRQTWPGSLRSLWR